MLKQALAIVAVLIQSGCANLGYYAQAVGGHIQVMQSAQPISHLLLDPSAPPELREKLKTVTGIREFASRELGLPNNGSYRSYADLGRPYVVWNVFAAKEFSVDLESWCLLFVGCVNYRGYYDKKEAEHFAQDLQEQGLETFVAPIPAYSTLGFFNDPVLNTFLRYGEQEVARTVFHELAHQLVFIKGDSTFNESFATAVENEGMRRWLERIGTPEQLRNFSARQKRREEFQDLMAEHRDKLRKLYASPLAPEEKRRTKADLFAQLRLAFGVLKAKWENPSGYDAFFNQSLNNARLGSLSIYTKQVPAFEALLAETGYDLPKFYQRVAALAALDKKKRLAILGRLLHNGEQNAQELKAARETD